MLEHIKDPFNLIEIFLLNKIEYPCLNKSETKIKFLLMLGTNKQSYKTNILFEEKNNFTTPTDTATNLASEPKCNVNHHLISWFFEIPTTCYKCD